MRTVLGEDGAREATRDVLRLLGRRVSGTSALVIATYRDHELERSHPLRVVLGELPSRAAERLAVEPLSPAAVGELAAPRGLDAHQLHERTGGNALFVTEMVAARGGRGSQRAEVVLSSSWWGRTFTISTPDSPRASRAPTETPSRYATRSHAPRSTPRCRRIGVSHCIAGRCRR